MPCFYDLQWHVSHGAVLSKEPVSIDEVKKQARVLHSHEDDYLKGVISAARRMVEKHCRRSLVQQKLTLFLNRFPSRTYEDKNALVLLPFSPVLSVESVKWRDDSNTLQTIPPEQYVLSKGDRSSTLYPAQSHDWPYVQTRPNSVEIIYIAGLSANDGDENDAPHIEISENIPADIRLAMLLLAAHFYEYRVPVNIGNSVTALPFSVEALLEPYIIGAP